MEFELNTTKLLDDNGNDLLADIGISNMMEEATAKMVQDMNNRREAIIREKLKEKIGIDINIEEEQKRRFKRLAVEYRQNEETVYFNDGSIEGKRIVTFVKKEMSFDAKSFTAGYEESYY